MGIVPSPQPLVHIPTGLNQKHQVETGSISLLDELFASVPPWLVEWSTWSLPCSHVNRTPRTWQTCSQHVMVMWLSHGQHGWTCVCHTTDHTHLFHRVYMIFHELLEFLQNISSSGGVPNEIEHWGDQWLGPEGERERGRREWGREWGRGRERVKQAFKRLQGKVVSPYNGAASLSQWAHDVLELLCARATSIS